MIPGGARRDPLAADIELRAVLSPMADLPAGTVFGTLVHAVLETVDPQATDLLGELGCGARSSSPGTAARWPPDELARPCCRSWPPRSVRSPAGWSLRDVSVAGTG